MGLFDRFKKKENVNENTFNENKKNKVNYSISRTEEGKVLVEYVEDKPDFGQFYDTTRLIIDNIEGELANCRISWYEEDDAVIINEETGEEIGRKTNYENILTQIDLNLLYNDPNYAEALMKKLLNQKRVAQYLANGMRENPDLTCGKYVGAIQLQNNQYKKVFDPRIGEMSHNSPEMVAKRQRYQERQEEEKQNAIKRKQEEIAKLQSEIDDMSK